MNQKVIYRVFVKFHFRHLKALLITYFKNISMKKDVSGQMKLHSYIGKIHKKIMRRTLLRNRFIDSKNRC